MMPTPSSPLIDVLVGHEVVLDLAAPYVHIGRLAGLDDAYFVLDQVDVHDLRDTSTSREMYIVNARKYGIRVNRDRVYVRRDEVVSLSALADVLAE